MIFATKLLPAAELSPGGEPTYKLVINALHLTTLVNIYSLLWKPWPIEIDDL